jgi:hypothetical protein
MGDQAVLQPVPDARGKIALLDPLERLEGLDRRFQARSRMTSEGRNQAEISNGNGIAR